MQARKKSPAVSDAGMKGTVRFTALVGHAIAQKRTEAALKQGDLAKKVRLTQSALSRLESGVVAMTMGQLKCLAEALGTPAHELVKRAEASAAKLQARGVRVIVNEPREEDMTPLVAGAALSTLLIVLGIASSGRK